MLNTKMNDGRRGGGIIALSFILVALTGAGLAAYFDIRTWRIPNILTFSLAAAGLIQAALLKGFTGCLEHVAAMLIGLGIFFIFYLVGGLGAGDAKLMAALGAVMGIPFILYATFIVIMVGGVISVFLIIRKHGLRRIKEIMLFILTIFSRKPGREKNKLSAQSAYPFSIAIFIGSVLTIWLMYPSL